MLVAMDAHVEHLGIRLEDVLGAIAVVHIPVDNQDALQPKFPYGILGSNGNVVEYTEAVRLIRLGVVAGRANVADAAARLPAQDTVDSLQHRSGGEGGALEGARMQVHRIVAGSHLLQLLDAAAQQAAHRVDMGPRMGQTHLIRGGGTRRQLMHARQQLVVIVHLMDLPYAHWLLRMRGVVQVEVLQHLGIVGIADPYRWHRQLRLGAQHGQAGGIASDYVLGQLSGGAACGITLIRLWRRAAQPNALDAMQLSRCPALRLQLGGRVGLLQLQAAPVRPMHIDAVEH